jgi:hypothetical protein
MAHAEALGAWELWMASRRQIYRQRDTWNSVHVKNENMIQKLLNVFFAPTNRQTMLHEAIYRGCRDALRVFFIKICILNN